MTELYKVPATGGRTEQVLGTPAEAVCFDKAGHQFLYQDRKGFEDEWRKHHTSSITRDIRLYDAKTGIHTNLTDRAGEDRNPVLSPDGRTVYFLSERNGGSFNVYAFPLAQPREVKPITSFKTHPVRFLSMSDGGTLCYSYDGEIYTQQPDATPKKVAIELVRDDRPQFANLQSSDGATSAVVSPDGKQIAFTLRGEVFVTSADYATTKQVTHTPAREAGLSFATDNRTLAYASERGGNWQLYLAKIARKEDPNFPNATLIEEEVLLPSTTVERAYPQFSPDGKELAFIEDRIRLMVLNLETRIAILRMIAHGTNVQDDVLNLIAERFTENIRELEGALNRVTAMASLSGQPVTRALAEQTLQDFFSTDVEIKPTDIITQVAKYFYITFDDIVGRSRTKKIALARQIAMYLVRELTSMSLNDIGQVFGGKDHTTVMHAYTRINDEMQEKQEIYNYVTELTLQLKQRSNDK